MLILKGNFIKDSTSVVPWVALGKGLRAALPATVPATLPAVVLALLLPAASAGLASPLAPAPAAAPARAALRAPETVAAEFYGWYLETLDADQDPLSDHYERLSAYVARPLVDALLQRLQASRAGMANAASDAGAPAARTPAAAAPEHGDYFLQADRIEGAWLRSRVRAITVRQQARAAHVLVTLDGAEGATYALLLTMVLDNGAWKIRHVNRASVDVSESSPDRPVI